MSWTLGGTRIFVVDKSSEYRQIIARLQPIASGTVYHIFGFENPIFKISAYVVGESDLSDLGAMYNDAALHVFSGPVGFANFYVNSLSVKDQKWVKQTIRPDLDCETNVYLVDIELFQE